MSIYRQGWLGFGFRRVLERFRASDRHRTAPDRGSVGGLDGLCRGGWAERRGEKCSPATVSETETSDEYTDYIAVIYLTVGQSNELRMR